MGMSNPPGQGRGITTKDTKNTKGKIQTGWNEVAASFQLAGAASAEQVGKLAPTYIGRGTTVAFSPCFVVFVSFVVTLFWPKYYPLPAPADQAWQDTRKPAGIEGSNMRQITPHSLWLGHAGDGTDFRRVFDLGIRAIVQVAAEEPPLRP